jgi:hypothetical protein
MQAEPDAQQASLASLEDAAGKGDVARTCSLLNILRQQYTDQPRKQWATDTVRSLWARVLETMKVMQSPEVGSRSCCHREQGSPGARGALPAGRAVPSEGLAPRSGGRALWRRWGYPHERQPGDLRPTSSLCWPAMPLQDQRLGDTSAALTAAGADTAF